MGAMCIDFCTNVFEAGEAMTTTVPDEDTNTSHPGAKKSIMQSWQHHQLLAIVLGAKSQV
jgi:hypothetical protein